MNMKLKPARVAKKFSLRRSGRQSRRHPADDWFDRKGKYNPTLKLCIKIAKMLDGTLDEFFWEVEDE